MTLPFVILTMGLKGGVGRSTITAALARRLVDLGQKPAVLDLDMCNPAQPELLNNHTRPKVCEGKVVLPCTDGIGLFSTGIFLRPDDMVLWTGVTASGALYQSVHDVVWRGYSHVLVDTPPGLTDLHLELPATFPGATTLHVMDARNTSSIDRERLFLERLSLSADIEVFNFVSDKDREGICIPWMPDGQLQTNKQHVGYQRGIVPVADRIFEMTSGASCVARPEIATSHTRR